ncbi:MAG: formate dehydrogenase accessory sulfurtransferase FdhD [Burkholderiales bacterium]|jgi:formate dehydrogenase accessory protein FdhD|nr:formate dehydrogenase accessory sulfurtransferase FdhD [Burkholderiales bacterium]
MDDTIQTPNVINGVTPTITFPPVGGLRDHALTVRKAMVIVDLPVPVARVPITRVTRMTGELDATSDHVIEETPVALTYNGVSHAVLLVTPDDALADFALGFSLSEGILSHSGELLDYECVPSVNGNGIVLDMRVTNRAFMALKDRRRTLAGRTSCGLCGIESLDQVARLLPKLPRSPAPLSCHVVFDAVKKVAQHQTLRYQTGATHSAVWFDVMGALQLLREDVGRHNALDKLLGALARERWNLADGFVFVSSRASFEMVQKAAALGVSTLVAASAPTAMAIRLAHQAGIRLIGFARDEQLVVYTAAHTLTP